MLRRQTKSRVTVLTHISWSGFLDIQLEPTMPHSVVIVMFCAYFLLSGVYSGTLRGPDPDCRPSPSAPADSALYSAGRKTSGSPGTLLQHLMAISTAEDKRINLLKICYRQLIIFK